MAPLIARLGEGAADVETWIVVTAQHRTMLDEVLAAFDITPHHDLDVMRPSQSLADLTIQTLAGLAPLFAAERPDLVAVQGDTISAFAGGLAAFYQRIPVAHVEAGLRTGDLRGPFPEEASRRMLDVFADLCFAPTPGARRALLGEGVGDERILVTGNSVIDALRSVTAREHRFGVEALRRLDLGGGRRTLLVTAHRRESFGEPLEEICGALRELLERRPGLQLVFPVHLNPRVRETVFRLLGGVERATLLDPLGYLDFVHLMKRADLIATDSGGVQEEAPALGKPVLVLRRRTERPEGVAAGNAMLVGTSRQRIVGAVEKLLDEPAEYRRMARARNPYGDGRAAQRMAQAIRHHLGLGGGRPEPFAPAEADRAGSASPG